MQQFPHPYLTHTDTQTYTHVAVCVFGCRSLETGWLMLLVRLCMPHAVKCLTSGELSVQLKAVQTIRKMLKN